MNKQETVQLIALLAGNYDSIAKKDNIQKQLMINAWQECLGDLEYRVVLEAVKKTMIESENSYQPTVHEIRKNAIELMNPSVQRTAIEAWNEAYKMICNGLYMTEKQFNRASEEVKTFFGNVNQVKELAQTDTKTVNTVTKGQFLKQYEALKNRRNSERLLPTKFKETINQLSAQMGIKQIER